MGFESGAEEDMLADKKLQLAMVDFAASRGFFFDDARFVPNNRLYC